MSLPILCLSEDNFDGKSICAVIAAKQQAHYAAIYASPDAHIDRLLKQ